MCVTTCANNHNNKKENISSVKFTTVFETQVATCTKVFRGSPAKAYTVVVCVGTERTSSACVATFQGKVVCEVCAVCLEIRESVQ